MLSNVAVVCGEVVSAPVFSHDIKGENFYDFLVRSPRKTEGVFDDIVVSVPDRMCDINAVQEGVLIRVSGRYSSRNVRDEKIGRNRLKLFLLGNNSVDFINEANYSPCNHVTLTGFICKEPTYRETPLGREISDVLLAVNRNYGKSDYIPCILWGRNASFASMLEVGVHVEVEGRIQSRGYRNSAGENRVAYEVSCSNIKALIED